MTLTRKQELDVGPPGQMPPIRRARVKYAVRDGESGEEHLTHGPAASKTAWLQPWERRALGKQPHTFGRNGVGSRDCVHVFTGKKPKQNTWRKSIGERSFCPVVLTLIFVTQYRASPQ